MQPAEQPPAPNPDLEATLEAEIEHIRNADVPEHIIEEEIAVLRVKYQEGHYEPGTSPLLPQNIDRPLTFNLGRIIEASPEPEPPGSSRN